LAALFEHFLMFYEGRLKRRARQSRSRSGGFTRPEAMIVLGCLLALGALGGLGLGVLERKCQRITCQSALHSMAWAHRAWLGDGYVARTNMAFLSSLPAITAARVFASLSNELGQSPPVLVCPTDASRRPAADFGGGFGNLNASYFVNLNLTNDSPKLALFGDRNLSDGAARSNVVFQVPSGAVLTWTKELHDQCGNVAFGDASARPLKQFSADGQKLAIP
jgi:hypothetical protein